MCQKQYIIIFPIREHNVKLSYLQLLHVPVHLGTIYSLFLTLL